MTGALYAIDLRWPLAPKDVDVTGLKAFQFGPNIGLLFCATCSSPMFFDVKKENDHYLGIFTGTLTNEALDLVKFAKHIFVDDTLDGGASVWLRHNADGSEPERLKHYDGVLSQDWPLSTKLTGYEGKREDSVAIRCKCKGVDLVLHRGDYSDTKQDELPYNIDPKTHKFSASFCGCDSCRLQSGIDVFNWTFSELKNISFGSSNNAFPTSGLELKQLVDAKDPAFGTLTYYSSRADVQRYFCSNCSACIFYAVDDRPNLFDIAVGVLEASDGARAEGMLSWPFGAPISYREDGDGGWREKLFNGVEKDAEEYRIARGYPKNSARFEKDRDAGRSVE
jgi:hypothetical protein